MGLTVPAVHYSALASLPPDYASSISQHTPNFRLKLNQLFKKLLSHEIHHESIEGNENDQSIVLDNPNNNNSDNRTLTESRNALSERLPFTEPYVSIPKIEQTPLESSVYHKHCIRQEKFIDQKRHHFEPSYVKNHPFIKSVRTSLSFVNIPL